MNGMERGSKRDLQNSNLVGNGKLGIKSGEGHQINLKEDYGETLLKEYIKGYKDLVDEDVFVKFSKGDNRAMSDALNQIHWRSLKIRSFQGGKGLPNASLVNHSKDTRSKTSETHSRSEEGKETETKNQKWMEVVYITDSIFEETKAEALKYARLMEKPVVLALEQNNHNVLRYAINRLHRIKRSVSTTHLQGVAEGDSVALEGALKELLLCNWDGPIVKYSDKKQQDRVDKGEFAHAQFLESNMEWVDPNTKNMVEEGDKEGVRMATNQIHYTSLRNLRGVEYQPATPKKSYAQVVKNMDLQEKEMTMDGLL